MPEENTIPGTSVTGDQTGTTDTTVNNPTPEPTTPVVPPEPTFTKSQVNELMQKRVNRSHQSFFNRYGVKDLAELDNLVGQANSYGPTKEKYDLLNTEHTELTNQFKELNKKYAYKMHNINPEKANDIETYFKGRGIDIDENSLLDEIKAHPDWVNKVVTIQNLGAEVNPAPEVDEREMASKIFGVDLTR